MSDLLVFLLLFAAIAIGWFLGRRSQGNTIGISTPELPGQYYKGLNYLLDGRPDGAIDAFIKALDVNSETFETHIALGNLLRKRGEVDRAIRIHQNLLARPSLPRPQVHLAHLELARDYISAGLLDRAERLLIDLVEESPEQRVVSQSHLLEIYQSEREWRRAIEVATELLPRKGLLGGAIEGGPQVGQEVSIPLSHYYCELAAEKLAVDDLAAARELLAQAIERDRLCVRASLMIGEVECRSGNYKKAVRALRTVRQQDPDYVAETIGTLRECASQMGEEAALQGYLQDCLAAAPSPALVMAVAEDLAQTEGVDAAAQFLTSQLADTPSLRGLARLITLQLQTSDSSEREDLGLLQLLVNRLVEERPTYRCGHCGFAGRHLHWFCPGCKHWGTIKSIRGSATD